MINWFQDLRYALRQLRKTPGFTIAAVLTLTMAIGANAVVFSVLNGLILRPLNVPQAESLYLVERASDKDTSQSYPDYLDLRDRNHSFDSLAAYTVTQVAMNTGEGPSLIWGMESSSNYFDALRIQPYLGRFFNLSDDHGPNSAPYIVLSYAYWHSHFHDDRSVVGQPMAGYSGDGVPTMQKRMLDAIATVPGLESVGLTDALLLNDQNTSNVFTDRTTDLRSSSAAASAYMYHVSPEYLHAEGTALLSGRAFTWHDDKDSPRVAVVNAEFARKIFGSVQNAIGGYYKLQNGTRLQVVGISENGKYGKLTEEPKPAMFLPILQWPSNSAWMVVRSGHDPQQLGSAIRSTLHQLDAGLPVVIETRLDEIAALCFLPRWRRWRWA
jgi:hypothetical protein